MQVFLGNQDVTLTIALTDAAGNALDASVVEYRVLDQKEQELVAKGALTSFNTGDAEVAITVLAAHNALETGQVRAIRVIELFVTTPSGIVQLSGEYIIDATSTLTVGVNSFQTFSAATLIGFEIPNLPGWSAASRQDRIHALAMAYRSFARVRLRFVDDSDGMTRLITPEQWDSFNITKMSAASLQTLPEEYLSAVCRAQVIEADSILGGDEVEDIRRSGVISATVGESSQFFRNSVRPLELPLCRRAMKEIGRYLLSTRRVGRG